MKKICVPLAVMSTCCSASFAQPYSYQLEDASVSGDVEWSVLGKINWRPIDAVDSSPWKNNPSSFFGPSTSEIPTMTPYGDVLAYTASGVGDVNGDGYGDYAITWYEADKDRGDPRGNHPHPWTDSNSTVVNNDGSMERVGFVRVISGKPGKLNGSVYEYSGTSEGTLDVDEATGYTDTLSVDGDGVQNDHMRRIGAPSVGSDIHADFWGTANNALWSHEITTVGDMDGDGRDDMMLSSNLGMAGRVEIWAYSDRYHDDPTDTSDRWVRLLVITGVNNASVIEEMAYQSYEGPPPNASVVSFSRDFNNDGQQDLMISSKFYREDNLTDRDKAIGAAWIYMMPKSDVFDEIDRVSAGLCDSDNNRTDHIGADSIVDLLPLRISSSEYNVRIKGGQSIQTNHSGASDHYPRHFGYDISPAGDIDNDGKLDLVVSAPFHYDESEYAAYESSGIAPGSYHTGRLYFFLSASAVRTGMPDISSLLPKHYVVPAGFRRGYCNGQVFFWHLWTRSSKQQQIDFDSSLADYVMEGSVASGSFESPPFAGSFIAGVSLNTDGTGDSNPDLAVFEGKRNRFYVFNDIQTKISSNAAPTQTQLLWDADPTNWVLNLNGAVFDNNDVFEVTSGYNSASPEEGMVVKGIRNFSVPTTFDTLWDFDDNGTQDQSLYAGISGISLAGDLTGDGDCEIMISAIAVWYYQNNPQDQIPVIGAQRQASVAIDILSGPQLIELHAEYLPEGFAFEDADLTHPRHQYQDNDFNAGSNNVQTFNLRSWPVWNPGGIADTILGVRYFPRRVEKYPDSTCMNWLDIPVVGSGGLTGEAYDKTTVVPAGKAYLVRSIDPNQP